MKQNYGTFVMVATFVLGCGAFMSLFAAPIDPYLKLFFGATLLLAAVTLDAMWLEAQSNAGLLVRKIIVGFQTMESRSHDADARSVVDAFTADNESMRLDDIAGGQGSAYVLVTLGKYALWVGGGWLLATFMLPRLTG